MTNDALVLAGGGVAGIAWETGLLLGLQESRSDVIAEILSDTTTLIGTSAGSTVAAQLALGLPLSELFAAQVAETSAEVFVEMDLAGFPAKMAALVEGSTSREESLRRIGEMAREADTPETAIRMHVIGARIPSSSWPDRPLSIPAVDTADGSLRVFDRESGVSLVDAVAASCAVPGIWPTVAIDGHDYMDGGTRTVANLDLAAGAGRVVVLVPAPETSPYGPTLTPEEIAALGDARVHVVYADAASIAAMGANPLDPAARIPTARAARAQGRAVAEELARFWS